VDPADAPVLLSGAALTIDDVVRIARADTKAGLSEQARAAVAACRAHLDDLPVGRPVLLRELRRTPVLVSLLLASRLPSKTDSEPQYLLYTQTLVLVRGKALSVTAYTIYGSPADQDWLLGITQRWTEDIQQLNGR